jgi:hypothetical protein
MTLPEMKQALALLEALPVAERTPEKLDQAEALASAIRRAERASAPRVSEETFGTKGLLVHVPIDLHRAFQKACRKRGETMSTTLRALIRAYVDDEK